MSERKPDLWWAHAVGARCRGLLLAARHSDEADTAFEQALRAHDRLPQLRYDRTRTVLAAGQHQRRRGRRRDAHAMLAEGAGLFEQVGTARWAITPLAAGAGFVVATRGTLVAVVAAADRRLGWGVERPSGDQAWAP